MKLNLDRLPRTVKLLADILGQEAALALVQAYGGQTIWPAKGGAAYAALAETIGEPAAAKLVKHWREPLSVPLCHSALRAVLRDYVRAEFDQLTGEGLSARKAIAAMAGKPPHRYTDRYIWTVLSSVEGGGTFDTHQSELF